MTTSVHSDNPALAAYFPASGDDILGRIHDALQSGYAVSEDGTIKAYVDPTWRTDTQLNVIVHRDVGHWGYPSVTYFESDSAFTKGMVDAITGLDIDYAPESVTGALTLGSYNPVDAENDHEYTAISTTYQAWQATGDTTWMATKLAKLNTWWATLFASPVGTDSTTGLPKRVHTADMWDFDFYNRIHLSTIPEAERFFNVLTTDVAGYYAAANMMAKMYTEIGNAADAARYAGYAASIKAAADAYLWDPANNRYRIHRDITLAEGQSSVGGVPIASVSWAHTDADRFSLMGNAFAIESGLATGSQITDGIATLKTWLSSYVGSGKTYATHLIPLFHPEYPSDVFQGYSAGEYMNGSPAMWVSCLWAKVLLDRSDPLGWTFIKVAMDTVIRDSGWAFFYNYDGTFSSQLGDPTLRANMFPAGQMCKAIVEGLAGIRSDGAAFDGVNIKPQWGEIGVSPKGCTYTARAEFPASSTWVAYELTWSEDGQSVTGTVTGTHGGGTLEIPGMTAVTLIGGTQAISTQVLAPEEPAPEEPATIKVLIGGAWLDCAVNVRSGGAWV